MKDVQAALLETYGDRVFDSQSWLVSQGTATEILRDTPASSLSSDGVHLTDAGYEALASQVYAFLKAKGW